MSEHHGSHELTGGSAGKRHMLMMVLCCALPIIAVMAVLVLFPGNPYSGFLILVLCPLAMLLIHLPQALSRKKRSSEKHEH